MRSLLANAVVLAGLLVPLCLYAQPRGASHSSLSRSGGSNRNFLAVPRRPAVPRRAGSLTSSNSFTRFAFPPVTGSSLIDFGQSACLLNPSYAGSLYCRQYYSGRPSLGFEPVYPYWLPSGGYETDQPAPEAAESGPDPLTAQVGNLAAQVEMMREDQAARESRGAPFPEPSVAPEEKPPTTLFVYRDGRQMEVQNYAILGNTLWVFSDQTTRRVPLADLDLAATARVNGERGVDFVPPTPQ